MSSVYTPSAVSITPITIPSDGDQPIQASDVNPAFEALADGVAYCNAAIAAETARAEAAEFGRLLSMTVLTSASGTHTVSAATNKLRIRGVGAGGSGGGCTSVGSAAGAGGGGAAGSYAEKLFTVTPSTGYAYVCGAAVTGTSGAGGSTGNDSTFDANGTTVTASGGGGGNGAISNSAVTTALGGFGNVSTLGDVNGIGEPGDAGVVILVATPVGVGGKGGSGPFGAGGKGCVSAGAGNNASGYGAGGSGALTGASAARAGGSSTAGMWIVEEFS